MAAMAGGGSMPGGMGPGMPGGPMDTKALLEAHTHMLEMQRKYSKLTNCSFN